MTCELKVCEINQLLILLNTLGCLERRRLELIESVLSDLNMVTLVRITTDFWTNKFSSGSYLTVTLHYK